MASEKALYWLAVGVMGIMFMQSASIRFQDRLDNLGARSVQAAQRVSATASGFLSMAEINLGIQSSRCPRVEMTVARLQSKMACAQSVMAREQAGFARLEAARVRMQMRMAHEATRLHHEQATQSF